MFPEFLLQFLIFMIGTKLLVIFFFNSPFGAGVGGGGGVVGAEIKI